MQPNGVGPGQWTLRAVPESLADRYLAQGWWDDQTLGNMVERGLGQMSSLPFRVRSQVRPYDGTFADIDRAARSLARTLRARGVGPGDVVVFQIPNWVEAAVTFWAAAYLGAVVVPIVHFYGAKEVEYILRVTKPSAVVTADRFGRVDFLENWSSLLNDHGVPIWLVVNSTGAPLPPGAVGFETALEAEPIASVAVVDPDLPAVIGFTSGTTQDPKGVIHSHRSIGCETRQLNSMYPGVGPPMITGAPVGHFMGMVNALLVPLVRTSAVCLVDVWDPERILRLMLDEGLGVGGGATYFLMSLLDHPTFTAEHLALMPFAGLGGSTVPAAVTDRAEKLGIKCYRSYGSTEHPSITASFIDEPQVKRCTTDGHTMPGVEIRFSEEGEIFSRGPDCFIGYTDAELTAKVFDAEGWYQTGDVGVLDDQGYLSITDRLSDIIIRGGENISAPEVEEQLMGIESIAEVSVVGVPDNRLGERAAAVIRLREGASPPSLDDVRAHLEAVGLARQKWPETLHEVTDFPRTPSGKVQKFRVRQQLQHGASDVT